MTAKEIFLSRIELQIKSLQDAYEYNKNLPDSLFENLVPVSNAVDKPTANVTKTLIDNSVLNFQQLKYVSKDFQQTLSKEYEYGQNKKMLISILTDEGKAMVKWNITKKFAELSGKSVEEVTNTITNTLATLNSDRTIIGYKPEGLKFKGYFWGLSHWFKHGIILPEYAPFKGQVLEL